MGLRLPAALRRFAAALVGLVALCGTVEWLCRRVPGLNFDPYIYPLGRARSPDLLRYRERFQHFHSADFFRLPFRAEYLYPAPDAVVYRMFFWGRGDPARVLLGFSVVCLLIAGLLFGRILRRRGISGLMAYGFPLLVLLCSYPVWSVLRQGNIEIVVWALVTAGLVLCLSGRGYGAAACFGLAASMKIYPVVYLSLLLARRRYRTVAWGVAVVCLSTVSSMWLVCPQMLVSWRGIGEGLERFRFLYMLHRRPEMGTDHSLFALGKAMLPGPERMARLLAVYLVLFGVCGMVVFLRRIRHLPVVNQIVCLAAASVLFPPVSYEYTLLHLLAPLALLVLLVVDGEGRAVPGVGAALVCLALLLAPLPELIWHGELFEGQVKAVVLVVLFEIALRWPFAVGGVRESGGAFDIA